MQNPAVTGPIAIVSALSAELAAKRAALEEYRSQLGVMSGFLHHFLCRNELFATVDPRVLVRIAAVH